MRTLDKLKLLTFFVLSILLHSAISSSVYASNEVPAGSQNNTFTLTVVNTRCLSMLGVDVYAYSGELVTMTGNTTQHVDNIAPGQNKDFTFTFDVICTSIGTKNALNFWISADQGAIDNNLISTYINIKGTAVYVPDNYPTIQSAIDNAPLNSCGHRIIIVRDGTYYENINFHGKAVMGLDNGGNGLSVAQELTSLDKYRPLGLKDRLRGFDFGSSLAVYMEDGREIKKPTKEFMTQLINGSLQRREIVLPIDDLDIESQFTTHTYTLNNGRVQYSKGNDHIIDAVRCALLVRNQFKEDSIWGNPSENLPMPLLTDPIFV